jgi:cytochrome c-type biogenesis protein CcmH/NrfG
VLTVTGAIPTAVRTLARYLESSPTDVEALCALGAALLAMQQRQAARMVWDRARALRPTGDGVRALGDAIARVESRVQVEHLPSSVTPRLPIGATS